MYERPIHRKSISLTRREEGFGLLLVKLIVNGNNSFITAENPLWPVLSGAVYRYKSLFSKKLLKGCK